MKQVAKVLRLSEEFAGAVSQLHSWLESADRDHDDPARCPSDFLDYNAPEFAAHWATIAANRSNQIAALVSR